MEQLARLYKGIVELGQWEELYCSEYHKYGAICQNLDPWVGAEKI